MEVLKFYTKIIVCQAATEWELIRRGVTPQNFESVDEIVTVCVHNIWEEDKHKERLKFDEMVNMDCLAIKLKMVSIIILREFPFVCDFRISDRAGFEIIRDTIYFLARPFYRDTVDRIIENIGINEFN